MTAIIWHTAIRSAIIWEKIILIIVWLTTILTAAIWTTWTLRLEVKAALKTTMSTATKITRTKTALKF